MTPMTPLRASLARRRRPLATAAVFVGICAAAQWAIAPASAAFDVQGYESCTSTATPGPDQNFDSVATSCCVDNAGVPANTNYGVGCVAPVENPPADYRPTIVLPVRPTPPGEGEDLTYDELMKLPPLPDDGVLPGDVPPP
ncbi:hypothetical protein [Mycolicibacterium alvei]|uniref:DUF2946 domain-containing protein n=1 Tax=Mycolicibacterium alvei TaxID=67081 RepID=A0A6N4UUT3_9MYCO|nr:hypothetical protein [Mycolicibacterium alvei]MCV6999711.1 hypothetical protein [Mycolicibacterium alvei]BBX28630.1 hypothetical protein MALV_37550 [Mycolicibacterium alvei]